MCKEIEDKLIERQHLHTFFGNISLFIVFSSFNQMQGSCNSDSNGYLNSTHVHACRLIQREFYII